MANVKWIIYLKNHQDRGSWYLFINKYFFSFRIWCIYFVLLLFYFYYYLYLLITRKTYWIAEKFLLNFRQKQILMLTIMFLEKVTTKNWKFCWTNTLFERKRTYSAITTNESIDSLIILIVRKTRAKEIVHGQRESTS